MASHTFERRRLAFPSTFCVFFGMQTQPQLQRARLAAKKLANSREFRARVWYLAGASLTPDSPRYSPHNNSHACSPVWRVYSPRMGKFPCQNLGRTESKLPQLCLLAKETIRGYWSTLIRRKKILKKMNLLKVSKNWLVGMTNHRLYKKILEMWMRPMCAGSFLQYHQKVPVC